MRTSIWTSIGDWNLARPVMGGLLAAVLWVAPAHAFTEVQVVPSVPGTSVMVAPEELRGAGTSAMITPPSPARELPALGLIDLSTGSDGDEGTVLSIPGIGTIGVLPRLDFGLELLYGTAKEPKAGLNDQPLIGREQETDSDVLIRGTIKHRF